MSHPSDSAIGDNRRALRKPIAVTAQIRDGKGPKFACRLRDLSATGFRAEAVHPLSIGDTVWVTLPGMSGLEAQVAWRDDFTIGCRFKQPLYGPVFDNIVRANG